MVAHEMWPLGGGELCALVVSRWGPMSAGGASVAGKKATGSRARKQEKEAGATSGQGGPCLRNDGSPASGRAP